MGYVLAFDTICTGWDCERDEAGEPYIYVSLVEAEAEATELNVEFDTDEFFVVSQEEFIEGRKAVWINGSVVICGTNYSEP
jgi:hypothetical protein